MFDKFKDETGGTLVELVMVMALLVFFGFTIFTLIESGCHSQQRIIDNKNAQVDARIALSYIGVRIRKNDSAAAIEVAQVLHTNEDAILLRNRGAEGYYDRWIYFSGGKLLDCITNPDEQPEDKLSQEIVNLEDFEVSFDPERKTITGVISYEYDGEIKQMSSIFRLRNTAENILIF